MEIIGAGRIGGALAARARGRGEQVLLVTRTEGWDQLSREPGAPILVATRNDDLADVIERVPAARRGDLVFLQNGMLRPFLEEHGLQQATRGILFLAVPSRGAPIEPGGTSVFHGPHAGAVVGWFGALDLPAQEVSSDAFKAVELEKLLWNSVFGLMCQVYDIPVGRVVQEHGDELAALVAELQAVGERALDIELDADALLERLNAYSLSIPDYQGAVKEWYWRNGWFVGLAERYGTDLPRHSTLVGRAGV